MEDPSKINKKIDRKPDAASILKSTESNGGKSQSKVKFA